MLQVVAVLTRVLSAQFEHFNRVSQGLGFASRKVGIVGRRHCGEHCCHGEEFGSKDDSRPRFKSSVGDGESDAQLFGESNGQIALSLRFQHRWQVRHPQQDGVYCGEASTAGGDLATFEQNLGHGQVPAVPVGTGDQIQPPRS